MKKLRVLLVHNFYQIGGGEHTVFQNEKKLLEDNGHDVIIYTRNNKEINSLFTKLFLPIITIFNFRTYFEVKKIIKKEAIDIVHCHNTFPLISPSVYYASKSLNTPVVQTIHNFRLLCPSGIFYRNNRVCEDCMIQGLNCSIKNKCYRNSKIGTGIVVLMLKVHRILNTFNKKVDRYIVLTEFNARKLEKIIEKDKIIIKPNFSYTDSTSKGDKSKNYFLFVGRLEESKGVKFLLDSWVKIDNEELVIIGDGSLKDYVKNISDKSFNIHYLGNKAHKEVLEIMRNSKSLIFSSEWYEGFPMVILEAMSQGIPIITSNIGNGSTLVVDNYTGLHYEVNNFESFIKQINRISNNNEYEKLGENAKRLFHEKYTSKENYTLLYSLYQEVINYE